MGPDYTKCVLTSSGTARKVNRYAANRTQGETDTRYTVTFPFFFIFLVESNFSIVKTFDTFRECWVIWVFS